MILACSIYICTHKIYVHLYDKVCQLFNSNLQPLGFLGTHTNIHVLKNV